MTIVWIALPVQMVSPDDAHEGTTAEVVESEEVLHRCGYVQKAVQDPPETESSFGGNDS